jgi:hypothetical protein
MRVCVRACVRVGGVLFCVLCAVHIWYLCMHSVNIYFTQLRAYSVECMHTCPMYAYMHHSQSRVLNPVAYTGHAHTCIHTHYACGLFPFLTLVCVHVQIVKTIHALFSKTMFPFLTFVGLRVCVRAAF